MTFARFRAWLRPMWAEAQDRHGSRPVRTRCEFPNKIDKCNASDRFRGLGSPYGPPSTGVDRHGGWKGKEGKNESKKPKRAHGLYHQRGSVICSVNAAARALHLSKVAADCLIWFSTGTSALGKPRELRSRGQTPRSRRRGRWDLESPRYACKYLGLLE